MVLDSLDGRVARMTNTQSAFGEQMDSLSDMVSFGAAPALIAYVWALKGLGRWGWIAAFVYCACAALRLARFNVNTAWSTSAISRAAFAGCGSAGGRLYLADDGVLASKADRRAVGSRCGLPFALALYAGLTMVTNVPFYSFKDVQHEKSVPFAVIVLIALGIAVINIHPPTVMFGVCFVWFERLCRLCWRKAKGQQTSVISTSTDEPDERGLHK
jgi:CDP-diacylglycerol--serine O-phosphatidyltransferase